MNPRTDVPAAPRRPGRGVAEVLAFWALAFGGIVGGKAIGTFVPWVGKNVKAIAAALFLFLPARSLRKTDETWDDLAIPDLPWRSPAARRRFVLDLGWGLGVFLALAPFVVVGFLALVYAIPHLPDGLRFWVPYARPPGPFHLALPEGMLLLCLDQLLVVALPEEVFFRGYVQTRLREAWGPGRFRLFGVRAGAYFWVTQILFALAHLGDFDASRLTVFFPSILFGWLRERTGSIGASIWVHAGSNVLLKVLEASVF